MQGAEETVKVRGNRRSARKRVLSRTLPFDTHPRQRASRIEMAVTPKNLDELKTLLANDNKVKVAGACAISYTIALTIRAHAAGIDGMRLPATSHS